MPSPQPEVLLTVLEPVQRQASTYNMTDAQGQRFECRIGMHTADELKKSNTDDVHVAAVAAMMHIDAKLDAALEPLEEKCTRKEVSAQYTQDLGYSICFDRSKLCCSQVAAAAVVFI